MKIFYLIVETQTNFDIFLSQSNEVELSMSLTIFVQVVFLSPPGSNPRGHLKWQDDSEARFFDSHWKNPVEGCNLSHSEMLTNQSIDWFNKSIQTHTKYPKIRIVFTYALIFKNIFRPLPIQLTSTNNTCCNIISISDVYNVFIIFTRISIKKIIILCYERNWKFL